MSEETWPHTGNRVVYPPFPILDLPVSPFFDGCPQKQRAIKDRIKERQSPGAQNSRVFYFLANLLRYYKKTSIKSVYCIVSSSLTRNNFIGDWYYKVLFFKMNDFDVNKAYFYP